MIGTLRGRLLKRSPDIIIVDVAGVGYNVHIPLSTFEKLKTIDHEIFLYTHTVLKEDSLQLYGFLTEEEKDIFSTLLNVNGIGPKTALNIISYLEPEALRKAIEDEDIRRLTRIPGLGKKTAQRLILELRDKLPDKIKKEDSLYHDAISALVNLGYQKAEAKEAIEKVQKKGLVEFEDIIKEALKLLTGQD
ncbi:MAG: Holliday junction branch migration protein RuvA [Thermodesulfovibrionales bacterium]